MFPLDEELALLPGTLAPRQQSHLVHLANWMPFRHSSRFLEELLGVHISAETARRMTEEVGKRVEEKQTLDAKAPWKEEAPAQENEQRLVMSADGAMVPLTGGEWAEVRTLAMGEVPAVSTDPEKLPVGALSSFSRLVDAAHLTDLAEVETRRRRLIQAKEVCAVMDGAEWLQSCVEIHRAEAVRILDVPHAAEPLTKRLEALAALGRTLPSPMLERCRHVLKHRGPIALARLANRLSEEDVGREGVREHLDSVRKRYSLMPSPTFRRAGWPLGSGMVESANQ